MDRLVTNIDVISRQIFRNVKLSETKRELVFTSEPLDLASLLFSKAGKVEYIA